MHLLHRLHSLSGSDRVVRAGGCALNSVAMDGQRAKAFNETWIHPAAGDDGLSLGAALYATHKSSAPPPRYVMGSAGLGPPFHPGANSPRLLGERAVEAQELPEPGAAGAHGRGARSRQSRRLVSGAHGMGTARARQPLHPRPPRLAPHEADAQRSHQAPRGSAPSRRPCLRSPRRRSSNAGDLAPLLHVYRIRDEWRERLCAVAHVDQTGRLQTVVREHNPRYHALLRAFEARTGLPVSSTPASTRTSPSSARPEEAIDCFLRTHMDLLVIGDSYCEKPTSVT